MLGFKKNYCSFFSYPETTFFYLNALICFSLQTVFCMITEHERLRGLRVYVDNLLCYRWNRNTDPKTIFSITCERTLRGNVVKFDVPREELFMLCEIQIFGMYFG